MSVEGFRLGDRKNCRKNHSPAAAARRFQGVASTAAFAARGLTPARLSDYNLLQYENSRRGCWADLSWGGFELF
jgi:hypothetical protein